MFRISKKIKLFAFDLDGTLYVGDKSVPGAVELISYLRKSKYKVVFFTNNSAKTTIQVYEKLNKLGFNCKLHEVYTSSSAATIYLIEAGLNNLYVIGSPSFRNEIIDSGLIVKDDESAKNLIVGLDTEFNYQKTGIALGVLLRGGKFVVCNEDSAYPVDETKYLPGCGAMVGAIAAAAKKKPDFIVGKPNTYMLDKIAETFKVDKSEIIVVGDSYESDIMMALNYGCKSILMKKSNLKNRDVVVLENPNKILQFVNGK